MMPGTRRVSEASRGNQPNPAEAAEGEPSGMAWAHVVSVLMVPIEHRLAVIDPRDYKARRFYIRREVELANYGFPDDCEGWPCGAGGR